VSFTVFSGLSPLVATTLIRATGSRTAPAALIATCAALSLAGSFGVGRHGGNVLKPRDSAQRFLR